jgi:hypothetical protein
MLVSQYLKPATEVPASSDRKIKDLRMRMRFIVLLNCSVHDRLKHGLMQTFGDNDENPQQHET